MAEKQQDFPIEQQLRKDIQDAQRAKDQQRLDTLRMALGAIHNLEIARTDREHSEYGQPLTEDDCYKVLEQEVKKRHQAIELYKKAKRADLVAKEQHEVDVLRPYLAGIYLSDEQLRTLIADLIAQNGKEFKTIMPLAAAATRGKADGKAVSQLVKEMIQ